MAPGLDRYMVFNAGRYDAYARWYGTPRAFSHALATASAVGVQGADLVDFLPGGADPRDADRESAADAVVAVLDALRSEATVLRPGDDRVARP